MAVWGAGGANRLVSFVKIMKKRLGAVRVAGQSRGGRAAMA